MAVKHGRKGRLYVGLASDTATPSPVSKLTRWEVNFAVDKSEVTSFGDGNKTFVSGLPDASGTFAGFYDEGVQQLYTAATDGKGRKFYLYPNTDTTGDYFFGTGLFDINFQGAVDSPVGITGNWAASDVVSAVGIT